MKIIVTNGSTKNTYEANRIKWIYRICENGLIAGPLKIYICTGEYYLSKFKDRDGGDAYEEVFPKEILKAVFNNWDSFTIEGEKELTQIEAPE